jgi:hypothetical protein
MSTYNEPNTAAFNTLAWISFAIAGASTILGILALPIELYSKGYLALGFLYTVTSCFMVAKVVRDKQEAEKLLSEINKVKTEKLLKEGFMQS